MGIIVKSTPDQCLTIPLGLLKQLNWREGDEVKVSVAENSLQVKRLDAFLRLRGALADDAAFDKAMEKLNQAWNQWTPPNSASIPAR